MTRGLFTPRAMPRGSSRLCVFLDPVWCEKGCARPGWFERLHFSHAQPMPCHTHIAFHHAIPYYAILTWINHFRSNAVGIQPRETSGFVTLAVPCGYLRETRTANLSLRLIAPVDVPVALMLSKMQFVDIIFMHKPGGPG